MLSVYSATARHVGRRPSLGAAVAASIREIFRANLSRILAEKRVNQRDLATKLGVAPEVISRWKSARSFPETAEIDKLVNELKIHPEELFLDPKRLRLAPGGDLESALVDGIRRSLKEAGYDVVIKRKN